MPAKQRARTTGGELAYLDMGEGPVVVLLHGFPQSSFVWRDLAGLLAGRFRVIAPDLLGAGDSDRPVDTPLDVEAQTGYVRELLRVLGIDRFGVVGAGHGGAIAQLLAVEGPVEALVLLNPVVGSFWPARGFVSLGDASAGRSADVLIRTALDLGMGNRPRFTDGHLAEYLRPFDGTEGTAALLRFAEAMDGADLKGLEDRLAGLEIPVLILWGEEDPFMPVDAAEQLNEWISTSTLGLLPGCGHFLAEDAMDTIGPMIYEYLRARYLRAPHGHDADPTGAVMIQLERRPPWVDLDRDPGDDDDDDDDEEDDDQ
ncbi:MAG: alpha/beta fold hydrolase [Actinomycetota bacterium]